MLLNTLMPRTVLAIFASILLGLAACSASQQPSESAASKPAPANSAATKAPPFDAQRAYEHVKKQVEFGPHPAGSEAIKQVQEYLIGQLKSYGLTVTPDAFRQQTPNGMINMLNITAELPGAKPDRIIISSHYDSKYFKDVRFVGANDGGSNTGVLLEIARVLAQGEKPEYTIQFVFFDGEEAFCFDWDQCMAGKDHTYGSVHFADQLKKKNEVNRVKAFILLDMIGHKDLKLDRDDASTPWLVDIIWKTGAQLGYGSYFPNSVQGVGGDDHYPFLQLKIPSADLIHFFPEWHTDKDTIDIVSPESLKVVGETTVASLPKIEAHLDGR